MIKRLKIGHYRLTLTWARVRKVTGVNSTLEDGNHILMWDFDDVPIDKVADALRTVQARYWLPETHLLRTKEPDNYIAYCFERLDWKRAVEIVAQTEHVDWQFFRFGVYRGHFTLRVTPKGDRHIKKVDTLEGYCLPSVKPTELKSWVKYETLSWE